MVAGLFINGRRPVSKKQVKEAAVSGQDIRVEDTSLFGDGFSGSLANLAVGQSVTFVGPDPYTRRSFFGTITRTARGFKVS